MEKAERIKFLKQQIADEMKAAHNLGEIVAVKREEHSKASADHDALQKDVTASLNRKKQTLNEYDQALNELHEKNTFITRVKAELEQVSGTVAA